MLLLCFLYF